MPDESHSLHISLIVVPGLMIESQIENLNSELATAKNNLIEEQSATNNSDGISNQIDIVEFELSGGTICNGHRKGQRSGRDVTTLELSWTMCAV